jgi:WD40 repeat protein
MGIRFLIRCGITLLLVLGLSHGSEAAGEKKVRTDRHGDPLPPGAIARLGTMRFQNEEDVKMLVHSPDGRWIASSVGYGTIRLWEAASGKEYLTLKEDSLELKDLIFVPAGEGKRPRVLISFVGFGSMIRFWDLKTGKEQRRIFPPEWTEALAVSPDGKLLALGNRKGLIFLWNIANGKELRHWKSPLNDIRALSFTPDGKTLVCGGKIPVRAGSVKKGAEFRTIEFLDVGSGKRRRGLSSLPEVSWIALSVDGKLLAVAGKDEDYREAIQIIDLNSGKQRRLLYGKLKPSYQVALSRDCRLLAAQVEDDGVVLLDTDSGAERGKIRLAYPNQPACMNFSPDGRTLAVSHAKGRIRLWDIAARRWRGEEKGPQSPLSAVAIAPDGKTIVTTSFGEWPWLWERRTGKPLRRLRDPKGPNLPGITCAAFSPDGRTLALGDEGAVRLWDLAAARYRRPLQAKTMGRAVSLAYSRDGRWLASGSEDDGHAHYLKVWDAGARSIQRSFALSLHEYQDWGSESVAISPDGALLATTHPDGPSPGGMRVYRRDNGEGVCQSQVRSGRSVAFAPSGMLVASGGACPARVHDARTGAVLVVIDICLAHTSRSGLAFSPDGRLLAVASGVGVSVWDLFTKRSVRQFTGHRGTVNAVAFMPDGKALVSASEDGTALIWDLQGVPSARDGKVRVRWKDLQDSNRLQAHIAWCRLRASPEEAVALLRKHVNPTPAIPAERLENLIHKLDDDAFRVREQASRELKQLGLAAEKALRRAMASKPSPEVARRINLLLRSLDADWERDRPVRLLLAELPCPAARALLRELAGGNADSRLTREAKALMKRTERSGPVKKR